MSASSDGPSSDRDERLRLFAHDLNNPLTAVRLLAETLHDESVDARQRADLADLLEAADLACALVEALSATAQPPSALARVPVDLVEILRTATDRPALRAHVRLALPAALPMRGDRAALRRAFTDVLVNARRLGERHGPVEVAATEVPGAVEVVVRHPGGSLPPDLRHRVFEADGAAELRRRRAPVIASGLHAAKRVIEHHDGMIAFSDRPGALDLVVRLGR